jgi:hypothetical protein
MMTANNLTNAMSKICIKSQGAQQISCRNRALLLLKLVIAMPVFFNRSFDCNLVYIKQLASNAINLSCIKSVFMKILTQRVKKYKVVSLYKKTPCSVAYRLTVNKYK